jgi:cephalosporin hydroxylase
MQYRFDYNSIHGFGDKHDFDGFYEWMVEQAPRDATLVEIGCFEGRSLVQLGQCAESADKGLKVIGIDHCSGPLMNCEASLNKNVQAAGLQSIVKLIVKPSLEAAQLFEDNSLWMVFLDGDHTHESVAAEIDAWMPKVTDGGILCGHDALWHSVWQPLIAKLDGVLHDPVWMNCWWTHKQTPKASSDVDIFKDVEYTHPVAPWGYGCKERMLRNDGSPSYIKG